MLRGRIRGGILRLLKMMGGMGVCTVSKVGEIV